MAAITRVGFGGPTAVITVTIDDSSIGIVAIPGSYAPVIALTGSSVPVLDLDGEYDPDDLIGAP